MAWILGGWVYCLGSIGYISIGNYEYYSVEIEFSGGEPKRIKCGNSDFPHSLGFPLEGYLKPPSKEELMSILAGYYKRGPVMIVSSSES